MSQTDKGVADFWLFIVCSHRLPGTAETFSASPLIPRCILSRIAARHPCHKRKASPPPSQPNKMTGGGIFGSLVFTPPRNGGGRKFLEWFPGEVVFARLGRRDAG